MAVTRLDDRNSDLLADYRNVPDRELVARRGLFVAEGRLVVTRLLANRRWTTRSVLVTETACRAIRAALETRPEVDVYVVAQEVMNDITGFNIHRGCLAIAERPAASDWRQVAAAADLLVVLERVGNADNIGSVFRNVAALAGAAGGVLLGPACADPLYRKAIRTSMGGVLVVSYARADPWPGALGELRTRGWRTIALTPDEAAAPLRTVGLEPGRGRCAFVLGHEGDGLTPAALAACDWRARIPLRAADSVNVATAAAIALYEIGAATTNQPRAAPPRDTTRTEDMSATPPRRSVAPETR